MTVEQVKENSSKSFDFKQFSGTYGPKLKKFSQTVGPKFKQFGEYLGPKFKQVGEYSKSVAKKYRLEEKTQSFWSQTKHWFSKTFKMAYLKVKLRIKQSLYTERAIGHHASRDLPYSTLVLLGERLGNKESKQKVQTFIQNNEVHYKGQCIKLNDRSQEAKIREAIKSLDGYPSSENKEKKSA